MFEVTWELGDWETLGFGTGRPWGTETGRTETWGTEIGERRLGDWETEGAETGRTETWRLGGLEFWCSSVLHGT